MIPLYTRADLAQVYLPVGPMLQLDRVMEITASGFRAEMDLAEHWVFPCHFPRDPIFPACLQIEAAGQGIAVWAWHQQFQGAPRLARVSGSFRSPIVPQDEMLTIIGHIKWRRQLCQAVVELRVGSRLVAEIAETLVVIASKEQNSAPTGPISAHSP